MKKLIWILILLFAFTPVALAQSVGRSTTMELDGEIDLVSKSGGPAGESVIVAQGVGKLNLEVNSRAGVETFSFDVSGDTTIPLITGVKAYNDDIYVSRNTGGSFEHKYKIEIDIFPRIEISTKDITWNTFQRRIDFDTHGLTLHEYLDFTGSGWFLDKILFSVDDEEAE
jgi:hypothetical protein